MSLACTWTSVKNHLGAHKTYKRQGEREREKEIDLVSAKANQERERERHRERERERERESDLFSAKANRVLNGNSNHAYPDHLVFIHIINL